MRVLIVSDWPRIEGGVERYVSILREGLIRAGDEVRLMTSSAGSAAGGEAEYVAFGTERRSAQVALQVVNPWAISTMRRALREFEPDAVHINLFLHYLSPAILGLLRSVPTELVIHEPKPICPTGWKMLPGGAPCSNLRGGACGREGCVGTARRARDAPRYALLEYGIKHVDHVSTISRWMQEVLASSGIEADLTHLPSRRPGPDFDRRPAIAPHFVYGGRLDPIKGVPMLLRAFARLVAEHPDASLRICGDGPQRDELIAIVDDLGLAHHVSFAFGMTMKWLRELSPAWALVVPSLHREPLGLVAVEAIVHGVPVIATDSGGLAETVEPDVSGLLVPPGDEQRLADAMRAIAARRVFADHSIAPAAIDSIARKHDLDTHVASVRKLLGRLNAEQIAA